VCIINYLKFQVNKKLLIRLATWINREAKCQLEEQLGVQK